MFTLIKIKCFSRKIRDFTKNKYLPSIDSYLRKKIMEKYRQEYRQASKIFSKNLKGLQSYLLNPRR